MNIATLSRVLISGALLLQLYMLTKNKYICSTAFFIWAFASYLMAYDYYKKDNKKFSQRVSFKIFNSTLLVLIAILAMR